MTKQKETVGLPKKVSMALDLSLNRYKGVEIIVELADYHANSLPRELREFAEADPKNLEKIMEAIVKGHHFITKEDEVVEYYCGLKNRGSAYIDGIRAGIICALARLEMRELADRIHEADRKTGVLSND